MSKTAWKSAYGCLLALFVMAGTAFGNGITVTNVTLKPGAPDGYVDVQFDVAWSNSWRATWTENTPLDATNWDAAWVFIKWRYTAGDWHHAILATNGHTASTGAQIDTVSNGVGAFIYRSTNGYGNVNYNATKLRWNLAANGVSTSGTNTIDVSVQAIEMVYVPQGSFYVGSGGSGVSEFYQGGGGNNAYLITNEAAIAVGTTASTNLYYASSTYGGDRGTPIPAAFPKGFSAFYCMKYEITQGEYTDFLNKLMSAQALTRYIGNQGNSRQTIGGSWPNYTNAAPDRAANYVGWSDGAAYAAWAGLRPMSELEFEKACRGIAAPVPNEYAWGTATIGSTLADISTTPADGSGSETGTTAGANCLYVGGISGPVRVGIFATANSTRYTSGASYWGSMEMSGNLWERPVPVGSPNGRAFTGSCGSGILDANGNATNSDWYASDATGAGFRGGAWINASALAPVSDRFIAANVDASRSVNYGWRAVGSAP